MGGDFWRSAFLNYQTIAFSHSVISPRSASGTRPRPPLKQIHSESLLFQPGKTGGCKLFWLEYISRAPFHLAS